MDKEVWLCSMDLGCITPVYVYRMWGGMMAMGVIAYSLEIVKTEI